MDVMFVLVLASLFVALGFLAAFLWAVRSGQFDDRYTPSVRMLMDDLFKKNKNTKNKNTKNKPDATRPS